MRFFTKIILVVLLLGVTLFANGVATVTALKGEAFLKRDNQKNILSLGDELLQKDSIVTGAKAKVQIIFKDETVVTIGRNSNFSIDEYMFEDSKDVSAKFGMFGGAMRAITGKIGKIAPQKFKVKTKTATIGIRGTNFTVVDADDGSTSVYCTYGAISVSFNGTQDIVKQGFYLYISSRGEASLKEFSASDLNKMRKKNFGKSEDKNGKTDEESELISQDDGQIDTTKEPQTSDIIVRDISDRTQDASQTDDGSCSDHDGSYDALFGYAVGDFLPDTSDYVDIFINNQTFDSQYSYLLLNNLENENGKVDSWRLFLDSTPISYTSKEEFEVGFSGVEAFPGDTSSTTTNPYIRGGIFTATGDDLIDGDYMSWGSWSAEIEYEYTDPNGGTAQSSHYINGLWVAGEPTDSYIIDGLNGESSYLGIYRAKDMTNNGSIVNGTASMHVDFGNDTASLYIDYDTGRNFDMTLQGNRLYGSQTDGTSETGTANGTFYGPLGTEIGGNFSTTYQGGQEELIGVYQVQIEQP